MPTLSDKLKSMGVKIGARDLPPPRPHNPYTIEDVLGGSEKETPLGETFIVEALYSSEFQHGYNRLQISAPLNILAAWAGDMTISENVKDDFAFLDIETTGLSGGTGTYAFLIGVGRFEGENFRLAQFFMRDPIEEPAQLAALEEFLIPCHTLVTFNGKSFDLPLLKTRYITHGWKPPFNDTAHVDLLHLARRLWRNRLPSRTLGNLEVQILGASRTEDDVPGWMIPQIYFDYLRSADARPLKKVFYHNAMDILSLVTLLDHTAGLLSDPINRAMEHKADLIAVAKLFEDLGDQDMAVHLYNHTLEHDLPEDAMLDATLRLALIHKRRENFPAAVSLWEKAARCKSIQAHVELAKFYEHRSGDYHEAIHWTQSAITILNALQVPIYERQHWLIELEHRLNRLRRLHIKNTGGTKTEGISG